MHNLRFDVWNLVWLAITGLLLLFALDFAITGSVPYESTSHWDRWFIYPIDAAILCYGWRKFLVRK